VPRRVPLYYAGMGLPSRCVLAATILWLATACALGAERLGAYGADLAGTSVSGISSGGYMAVQFHLAHGTLVEGVGVFAGGPYACAQGDLDTARFSCMEGEPDVPRLVVLTRRWAAEGRIDSLAPLARARVWVFSGYNDGVVRRPVTEALVRYYAHFVPQAQIFHQTALPAGHAQVTRDYGAACSMTGGQYLVDCDYDGAGALLQFLHGRLAAPTAAFRERLRRFDQGEFAGGAPRRIGLADEGYVYVPRACEEEGRCRVHVAFHGCLQYAGRIGDAYARHAGYNAWAETNRLIVLYPQTTATWAWPFNPKGCWDWWGYTGPAYAQKDGAQIKAVRAMMDRLAEGASSGPKIRAALPSEPALWADAAEGAVALAWTPVPGANGYEVIRESGDGPSSAAHPVQGLSFADHGLRPETGYAYRVVAQVGNERREVGRAFLRTRPRPPACDPYFSDNVTHVRRGRAYVAWGWTYARGSHEPMGLWSPFKETTLWRVDGGYRVGPCP
jgi:poly(3-hydroxybutyrate) depolymerase